MLTMHLLLFQYPLHLSASSPPNTTASPSNLCKSCINMMYCVGTAWDSLERSFQTKLQGIIVDQCGNMTVQGLSTTIYGLGLMGVRWTYTSSDFKIKIQDVVLSNIMNMTDQGASNTVYGLALMGINWLEWRDINLSKLEHALIKILPKLNDQGTANMIYS